MKDITYYNKRCAEIMERKTIFMTKNNSVATPFLNEIDKFLKKGYKIVSSYHSDFSTQIAVWQKIVSVVVNMKSFSQSLKNDWANIHDGYVNQIHFGTPETAFTILCQAIDFSDDNGKEKGK